MFVLAALAHRLAPNCGPNPQRPLSPTPLHSPPPHTHTLPRGASALALARKDAAAAGLANLEFRDCSEPDGGLPTSPTYDLIYVLDALHDMARPDEV